jgi:hypothetical protein
VTDNQLGKRLATALFCAFVGAIVGLILAEIAGLDPW